MHEPFPELRVQLTKRADGSVVLRHLVGLFDREHVGGAEPMSAAEFNGQVEQLIATGRLHSAPVFTDAQLAAVRGSIDALHRDWAALAEGSTLELRFDRADLESAAP